MSVTEENQSDGPDGHRWRRGMTIVLSVVGLIVVSVLILPRLGFVQSFVRQQAVEAANASLAGSVEIDEIAALSWTSLAVEGVTVRDERGNIVVQGEGARARWSLLPLFSSTVDVEMVELTGVTAVIRTYRDGALNVTEIAAPSEDDSPPPEWVVMLTSGQVAGSRVIYWDETSAGPAPDGLGELTSDALEAVNRRARQKTDAFGIVDADELELSLSSQIDLAGGVSVDVDRLKAALGVDQFGIDTKLSASDLEVRFEAPFIAVDLGILSASELASLGEVSVQARLEEKPTVSAVVAALAVEPKLVSLLTDQEVLASAVRGRLRVGLESGRVDATGALSVEEGGAIEFSGRLDDFEKLDSSGWALALNASEIDVARWSQMGEPAKRGSARIVARGKGTDPDTASGAGSIWAGDLLVDVYTINEVFLDLSWSDGEAVVERLRGSSPYATVSGRGAMGLNGQFAASLDLESRDALGELTSGAVTFGESAGGFVTVSTNGKLDLEATEPARMLVDGELQAEWRLTDFSAEDITIDSSTGDVSVRVDKALDGGSRRLRADVQASGRQIRGRGYRVSSFDVDVDAGSTFSPPYADVSDFTRRLDSNAKVRISGLSGPDITLSSARVDLETDERGSSSFAYDLDAEISRFKAGTTKVGAARTALRGSVTIGSGQRIRDILSAVAIKGSVGVEEVDAGDAATVRTGAAEIDVRGPTQNLQGRVEVAARGADFAQYDFQQLVAILKLEGRRSFVVDVDATQETGKPRKFDATIIGSYAADLMSYTIEEIRFAAGDQNWSFSDGFSFSPQSGRYEFEDVTISHDGQEVRLDGYFHQGRDQNLRVEVDELSIADLRKTIGLEPGPNEPQIRGNVSLEASLTGTSRDPDATFDAWIRDLYVDEQGPFDIHLVGRYGEDLLVVEKLEGWAFEVQVLAGSAEIPFEGTLEGAAEILWEEPFILDLRVPTVDVARFHNPIPALERVGARGEVSLKLVLDGELSRPLVDFSVTANELAVEGELNKKPLALGPYDLELSSDYEPGPDGRPGNLATTGFLGDTGATRSDALVNLSADLVVDAPGWLADLLEGRKVDWMGRMMALPYDLEASVDGFDLRRVGLATMQEADAEGVVDLKLSGDATIGDPQLELEARLDDFGWNRYRDVVFDLRASLDDDLVRIRNVRLEWDRDEILTGSGKVPFPTGVIAGRSKLEDLPVDLSLQLSRLPMSKFQAVDYTFASIRGTVGGYVTISGQLSDPSLSSRLSIVDTMFADGSTGTVAVDVTASDNRVDVIAQVCQGPKPTVDFRASVPLNLDLPSVAGGEEIIIDGPVSGRLVASRVSVASLVPEKLLDKYLNETRGTLSADLNLTGTVEDPRALGDLRVQDGGVFLQDYGRRFSNIDLDVSFRPDGIRVRELEVNDGRGSIEATGKVGMVAFKPDDLRFRVRADEFGTVGFTPIPMFVTSDIDIRGVVDGGLVDGDIDISSLEVKIPETSSNESFETELSTDIVMASEIAGGTKDGFLSLDDLSEQTETTGQPFARFTVEIARDSWVRHPIGDVNMRGSLDIEVAPTGATIGGEVEALRGDFKLLGKRFEVRRGVVTFTGANPPNPRLDVEAVYLLDRSLTDSIGQPTSGKPRVIVEVSGTPNEPELNLSSDPQMPEDDIIYVLVTGRPPDSTGVGEREGVANTALSAASGIFAGILQQKLEGSIPVDVLRVESGEGGFGDYRVEAGKYLTERLFLSLRFQFGAEKDENATTVSIEYRFAPRWTLEFEAGDRANGEANIFWDVY